MKTMRTQLYILPLLLACCINSGIGEQKAPETRPPAWAGQFYPSDRAQLKLAVRQLVEDAVPARVKTPIALVVPHAGYLYSGQIAADGYRQAAAGNYDVVVILGTNHVSEALNGISVYPRGAYRTPLGDAIVDEAVAGALLAEDPECSADTAAQAKEHSIEVQVPFIQHLFPAARIVPVMIGRPDPEMCARLGRALGRILKGRRALIVASSDLSHFPGYQDAVDVDRQTLESVAGMDPGGFDAKISALMSQYYRGLGTCACGAGPILAAMSASKALGATYGVVMSYANSGDVVAGDRSRVVGYGSVVFAAGPGEPDVKALSRPARTATATPLQPDEKKALLRFARSSLERYLSAGIMPLGRSLPSRLQYPQGAFVTLKQEGRLRGCIGYMAEDTPVGVAAGYMAVQAGVNDSRFPPVSLKELAGLEIEISVLTPMKPISEPRQIVLGRDGVAIQKAGRSAVFLPQVATEQKWSLTEMLENLCVKAGLPSDAWKSGAQFRIFQADVFSEHQFK